MQGLDAFLGESRIAGMVSAETRKQGPTFIKAKLTSPSEVRGRR
jgi:hypothetical protein